MVWQDVSVCSAFILSTQTLKAQQIMERALENMLHMTISVNCITSVPKDFMQLTNIYAIISTSHFMGLIVMYM